MMAVAWSASWTERTPLAHHTFFPLWLGYVLTVDGIVFQRTGTSLFSRSRARFVALFFASVPLWWLFEAFNARIENWRYELPGQYSWMRYHAEASLAFSTVAPALFETAELVRSFRSLNRFDRTVRLSPGPFGWMLFSIAGGVMIALVLGWPATFFPLVWIGLFFLIDPLVHLAGGRSIAGQVERGQWSTVIALFGAGLTCGFFWEMWNSRAMPKWTYDIPYLERFHLFEMPLLGYGGYLPFALETYALVMLLNRVTGAWPVLFTGFDQSVSEKGP